MDEVNSILQSNKLKDVTWLCSLSESELDLLISLKKLVSHRARMIGHEILAEQFDLKMLRALGLILMDNVRGRVKDNTSLAPSVSDQSKLIESCNLLKSDNDVTMDEEEMKALLCINSKRNSRKRMR